MFLKFVQFSIRASLSWLHRLHICYKALLIMMIGMLIYLFTVNLLSDIYRQNLHQCYASKRLYDNDANVRWFDDILHSSRQPQLGRTIFFHQTTCLNAVVKLTNRYIIIFIYFALYRKSSSIEWQSYIKMAKSVENCFRFDLNP